MSDNGETHQISWRTVTFAAAVAVVALGVQQWLIPFNAQAHLGLFANGGDLEVYRQGGLQVLTGNPLYEGPIPPGAFFTYPPFAALSFTVLAAVPVSAAKAMAFIVSALALVAVVWRCWRSLGYCADRRLALFSVALAVTALDLEAVRGTLWQGQINLVLMALIVWDLTRAQGARLQGWSVGVAAGVKLSAIVFVPYLLVTRQWRAASTASLVAGATVALSWLILPSDSNQYWLHAVSEIDRIGPLAHPANYSLGGLLSNLWSPAPMPPGVWLACVATAALLGLGAAWSAHRVGHRLLAVALAGLTSCLLPPLAWSHHWVWFVPLIVWLLRQAMSTKGSTRWGWAGATTVITGAAAAWFSAWLSYRAHRSGQTYDFYIPAWDDAISTLTPLERTTVCGITSTAFILTAVTTIATIRAPTHRRPVDEIAVEPARSAP